MNKCLSDKIKIVSFFSMILVVYLHSYNLLINIGENSRTINKGYNSFIQEFVSKGVTNIAVPFFFVISGYLFFLNVDGYWNEFLLKYKKRISTLLVPYLLWSMFGILFYFTLQSVPISKPFFTKQLISNYSIIELLNVLFLKPIPYQLWFIRDLIILILFSPLIYRLVKLSNYFILLLLSILWLARIDYFLFSNEAFFFFIIGAFISIKSTKLEEKINKSFFFYFLIWLSLVLFKTILNNTALRSDYFLYFLNKISILFGIIAVWSGYDVYFKKREMSEVKIAPIFQYSFFIYVAHEPMLTIYKKVLYVILGQNEMVSFVIYVVAPILTISSSLIIGFFLKKHLSKLYSLLTGNR
ncbi:acyltransferase [Flavobacterium sp. MDT1-60]|uniref:acyltransferase family protein n=1 Tax=Flavobacterium sp. MDT1-60 TaxID=1979344 RepID=UPI00177E6161|nr:acyltransferase [Flavobacterium sp. MDT1-60]QOG04126.1 acyltransferase [Flavobacterium sp. MDT1-60]